MSTNTILLIQTVLVFGQIANAGLASVTHDPLVTLLIGAAVGAGQFFVQHVGNQTTPKG